MKKIFIYVIIAVTAVILVYEARMVVGGIIIGSGGLFNFPIDKEKMETIFTKDHELLITVKNYLTNSEYDSVYIPSTMESGEVSGDGIDVKVDDVDVVTAINTLKKRGYSLIGKDGNTIHFQRWSRLDNGRGIAYSVNGKEPTLQFLTKLEPLSESNWYYYEEDYNEWRLHNNGIPNHITGVWNIQYAKTRGADEDYPLEDLYGSGIKYGGKLTFNPDGTFSRYIGITTDEIDRYEGTYILSYDDKILLEYNDGTTNNVRYLPSSQEMVYYTRDANQLPIDEYYTKFE